MLILQILAFVCLTFSIACFFGPYIAVHGVRSLGLNRQARFISGFVVSALAMVAIAPSFGQALATGGETITLVALELVTLSFGNI
ncbi:MAG: hypothetical protein AAGF20_07675 [Pseudomonadota bacterium]